MHFRNKKAFATVPPELPGVNPRMSSILRLDRLRQFIGELATLLDSRPDESTLLTQAPLLAELVRQDDWLPEDCARPDPQRYQQYLLHVDSRQRFSVVSFVWGRARSHRYTIIGSGA